MNRCVMVVCARGEKTRHTHTPLETARGVAPPPSRGTEARGRGAPCHPHSHTLAHSRTNLAIHHQIHRGTRGGAGAGTSSPGSRGRANPAAPLPGRRGVGSPPVPPQRRRLPASLQPQIVVSTDFVEGGWRARLCWRARRISSLAPSRTHPPIHHSLPPNRTVTTTTTTTPSSLSPNTHPRPPPWRPAWRGRPRPCGPPRARPCRRPCMGRARARATLLPRRPQPRGPAGRQGGAGWVNRPRPSAPSAWTPSRTWHAGRAGEQKEGEEGRFFFLNRNLNHTHSRSPTSLQPRLLRALPAGGSVQEQKVPQLPQGDAAAPGSPRLCVERE
jgi:hypothetical protein